MREPQSCTDEIDAYWQEVSRERHTLEALLHTHYPDADWQDCEDAVSEAMLRGVLHLPVRRVRAYLFQVSRTRLRSQHHETNLQTRVRPGLLVPVLGWAFSPTLASPTNLYMTP